MIAVAPSHTGNDNRLTAADPDYRRLHARWSRRLAASIRTYAADLRRGEQSATSAFLARHGALIRTAYEDGHAAGQRHYWRGVSARRHEPRDPDERRMAQRLGWYGVASLAKLAQEGLAAYRASQTAHEPPTALSDAHRGILLAGSGDALDQWAASTAGRVALQAEVTWAGLNDGYEQAGANDRANPYYYLAWELGYVKTDHCDDCLRMAAGSPYTPPWVSAADDPEANPLNQTPGDGRTECGASCKCDLRYVPAGRAEQMLAGKAWQSFFAAQGFTPNAPDAGQGAAVPDYEIPLPQIPSLTPARQTGALPAEVRAALDALRDAADDWDAQRGDLPRAPRLLEQAFDAGDVVPFGLAAGLTPAQWAALQRLWDALDDLGAFVGEDGAAGDYEFAEDGALELGYNGGYNPYRDGHGRFAPGPHAARESGGGEGEGRGEGDGNHGHGGGGHAAGHRAMEQLHAARTGHRAAPSGHGHAGERVAAAHEGALDEHGQRLPFTREEFERARAEAKAFKTGDNANETSRATIHGRDYILKTADEEYSRGRSSEVQARNEAAFAAGLRALGQEKLAVGEAYHVVGADGKHYSVQSVEHGHPFDERHDYPDTFTAQEAILTSYLLGRGDQHGGNLLYHEGDLKLIDNGRAFRASRGITEQDTLREQWIMHGNGGKFSRGIVYDLLARQGTVEHALARYGLSKAEMRGVRLRFHALRKAATRGLFGRKLHDVEWYRLLGKAGLDAEELAESGDGGDDEILDDDE